MCRTSFVALKKDYLRWDPLLLWYGLFASPTHLHHHRPSETRLPPLGSRVVDGRPRCDSKNGWTADEGLMLG